MRIVILGGGTGGTLSANRLRREFSLDEAEIVVVDPDDRHIYQPGLLFVPFGKTPSEIVRSRSGQLRPGVSFREAGVDSVETSHNRVALVDGSSLTYDILVVATGARLLAEETPGLTGEGWGQTVHTFYSLEGAAALSAALARFEGGRLVVVMVDMPIKCPVAPLEFTMLAHSYFHRRGMTEKVALTYVTPLDGAFTRPVCNREFSGLLATKGIKVITEFNTASVDGPGGRLVSYDGREVDFDLAVVVPLHGGQAYVARSEGLGDELDFVTADEATLVSKVASNVFVIGDAAGLPVSKAGSVAHFQGETLVRNIRRYLADQPPEPSFDGHTNCFIESGFGKALLIDYNYDTEPLPGRYPGPVGLALMRQSRLNHLGKLAFQSLYWHALLPGRNLPGLTARMPRRGKRFVDADTSERTE